MTADRRRKFRFTWLSLILITCALSIQAQEGFEILITEGNEGATPIAVLPFPWLAEGPEDETDMAAVISADLGRSGQFKPFDRELMVRQPRRLADVNFPFWRRANTDYIMVGRILGNPLDGYQAEYSLANVLNGDTLINESVSFRPGEFRYVSHLIANRIYEELLDVPGVFHTRIAYVTDAGSSVQQRYSLMVADADGFNPKSIVRSAEPLLSPSWSSDASKLAYVSFEQGNSAIVVQHLASASREIVAGFEGINGAPAFSPDDSKLAMTLSRSGNPEIYVMDLDSRRMTQLTRHWAIDTEPAWSADGRTIYFTSDRGGKPQIYSVSTSGTGKPVRVTRSGEYNARASINDDGDLITLVNGQDNIYRIGLYEVNNDILRIISDGPLDESPSFAPNGRMVLYASRRGRQGVLSAMPVYGVTGSTKAEYQLIFSEGSIREPAWSPLPQ